MITGIVQTERGVSDGEPVLIHSNDPLFGELYLIPRYSSRKLLTIVLYSDIIGIMMRH